MCWPRHWCVPNEKSISTDKAYMDVLGLYRPAAISLSILDFQRKRKILKLAMESSTHYLLPHTHINGLSFSIFSPFFFFDEIPACSWISSVIIRPIHLIIMWRRKEGNKGAAVFSYSRRGGFPLVMWLEKEKRRAIKEAPVLHRASIIIIIIYIQSPQPSCIEGGLLSLDRIRE